MLPALQAIGMGLSAISAVGTVRSLINGSGEATPANGTQPSQSSAQPSAPTGAAGASASTALSSADQESRFLKLLVTQMKNQDPLNPLDNAQVTSQMAQLSTVSGIDRLNATLTSMAASFTSNQSLQAAGMIGRGVLAAGSTLALENGVAVGGVDVRQAVDRLMVTIRDSSGIAVHNMDLGPQREGVIAFTWDGITDSGANAVSGNYGFSVSAQLGDKKVDAGTLSFGLVHSVSSGRQGAVLDVGGVGVIGLSDIKQIL